MELLRIEAPLTPETARALRAGQRVLLSGVVYTARDAAHRRLCELLDEGGEPPVPLAGAVIYYCGPAPAPPGRPIGSAGPTSSYRMDPYVPRLLEAGMLNRGYYNELDLIPTVYYFYLPNVTYDLHPEILDSQLAAIQAEQTDYVVLQSSLSRLSPSSLPEDAVQAQLCLAALEHYQLVDVVKGTGAVDHLYYHLFVRR